MRINVKHITKDGNKMLIGQMDDSHLINTINMHFRNLSNLRTQLNAQSDNGKNKLLSFLDKRESIDPERIKSIYEGILVSIGDYYMEAVLRGLDTDEMRDELRASLGRSEKLQRSGFALEVSDGEVIQLFEGMVEDKVAAELREQRYYFDED
jgi:hypothetical protein